MSEEHALRGYGCRYGTGGASKGHEKDISMRLDLVTVPVPESRPQKVTALRHYQGIAVAQLLEEARGFLYAGEEQRDCPAGQVKSGGHSMVSRGQVW
jgi:hypothetical protein